MAKLEFTRNGKWYEAIYTTQKQESSYLEVIRENIPGSNRLVVEAGIGGLPTVPIYVLDGESNPDNIFDINLPVGTVIKIKSETPVIDAVTTDGIQQQPEPQDQPDYLCFTSQQDGSTLSMMTQLATPPDLKYSTDKVNWTQWQFTEGEEGSMADVITLDEGEKVYFKGLNPDGFADVELEITSSFVMSGLIAASGDIGTITDEVGGADCPLTYSCYAFMFYSCTSLTTTPTLPATTLEAYCYYSMFEECSSLTTAPTLPATTLAESCYYFMFAGCTSLTTAPALPATTLAEYCYSNMFEGCTSLTTAPALPATTLAEYCYEGMFGSCTALNSVTVGATSWNVVPAGNWLYDVAATGTFTKPSATEIPEGASGIPSGWTVVNV